MAASQKAPSSALDGDAQNQSAIPVRAIYHEEGHVELPIGCKSTIQGLGRKVQEQGLGLKAQGLEIPTKQLGCC